MRTWVRNALVTIGLALACALPSVASGSIYLKLQTTAPSIAPGDTFMVEAAISLPDHRFNAFDLAVHWDTTRVEFVPTVPSTAQIGPLMTAACANRFHQFNEYPDSVMTHVSLLCSQTFVTRKGVTYRMKFRAKSGTGPTTFTLGASTRFYDGGVYVTPLIGEDVTVMVGASLAAPLPAVTSGYLLEAPRPNPLPSAGNGVIAFRLPVRARVVLDLFDTQGRRAATYDAGSSPAGRSTVSWALPALPAGRYELRLRADGRVVGHAPWVKLR